MRSVLAFATPAAIVPTPLFGHQLHADFGFRIDVLQVEDKLCQVFDGIDVVMGRGRNQ